MIDPRELVTRRLTWERTRDPKFPWRTRLGGHTLELYDGEWPSESAYTLYVDGKPVGDLEGWPTPWQKDE